MFQKILFICLLFFASNIFSQNEIVNLGVDGKDLTDINFKDSVLVVKASKGGGPYSKESDVEIKYIDLSNAKIKYTVNSKNDKAIRHFNQNGKMIIANTDGFVGFGSNKASIFIDSDGAEKGEINKLDNKDIEYFPGNKMTYLTSEYLISVGPLKKGYKRNKNHKGYEPEKWSLYKVNLNSLAESTISFELPALTGKEENIGYVLMDVTDTGFYILSKNFSPTDAKENEYDSQSYILKEYNFDGKLVNEQTFTTNIDNSLYSFGRANLAGGTFTYSRGDRFLTWTTSASTGSISIDPNTKNYYVISVLSGKKDNDGTVLFVAKYDFSGEKQWEQTHKFVNKIVGKLQLPETIIRPLITDDKIYFFPKDYSFKNSKENQVFSMDVETGEIQAERKYKALKGSLKRTETWHSFAFGSIVENELSDKLLLDTETLITFRINNNIKEYLESLRPANEIYFYSHIGRNGTIFMIEADYKSQKYKLMSF